MQVQEIKNSVYSKNDAVKSLRPLKGDFDNYNRFGHAQSMNTTNVISFKSKRAWTNFRKLSEYMKEPSEMVSAIIQAIGTSIVAPVAILTSPYRNVHNDEEKKAAKEKKVFQAFRQPFSAIIALVFQVPATLAIAKTFDHYAFKNPIKFFADETIGNLIPDKKYLAKQAEKALKDNADSKLLEEWQAELEYANDKAKVKEDFIKDIKETCDRYGTEISDSELEKMASNKKKLNKFIADKMASLKRDKLLNAKVEELKSKHFDIKDLDLVTEEDMNLARHRFKDEFTKLKNEKLNWFDKCIKTMGFGTGKIKKYTDEEEKLAKEKGLELLKADKPDIFETYESKFKQFIKNRDENAIKIYKNKKFWIQLLTNLAMVAISCTVLNWMHPKFMDFWEGAKQAKAENEQNRPNKQKAEVSR